MRLFKNIKIVAVLSSIIITSIFFYNCSKSNPDIIPNISYELIIAIKDHTGNDALLNVDENEIQNSIKILGENNTPLKGSYHVLEGKNSKLLKITCDTDREIKLKEILYIIDGEKLLGTGEFYEIKAYWNFQQNNIHVTDLYFDDNQVRPLKESEVLTYYSIKLNDKDGVDPAVSLSVKLSK